MGKTLRKTFHQGNYVFLVIDIHFVDILLENLA